MLIYLAIVVGINVISANLSANDCQLSKQFFDRAEQLYQREQFLLSSGHFSQAAAAACTQDEKNQSLFKYSLGMIKLDEFNEAYTELSEIEKTAGPKLLENILLAKKLYFNADVVLNEENKIKIQVWNVRNNKKELEQISSKFVGPYWKNQISQYQAALEEIDTKNPLLAGTLSIVPGLGQVYVGAYQSAAISFLINSLFFMGMKDFYNNKQYAASVAAGLVFSITYVGNILNAVNMAHLKNNQMLKPYEEKMYNDFFYDLK